VHVDFQISHECLPYGRAWLWRAGSVAKVEKLGRRKSTQKLA
jgi:hypothetical protein